MRRLFRFLIVVCGTVMGAYTLAMGVYAVASTRAEVPSEPADASEAKQSLERLGIVAQYPFANGFVPTPHGRMHYAEVGSGAPVLLLHGNLTWSFVYRDVMTGLAPRARLIAPDLIGFGLSEKLARAEDYSVEGHVEDVSALIRALDLRDLTLVVHDWGGPIGLGVLMRERERVSGLVVLNTFDFEPGLPAESLATSLALRSARAPVLGEQLVQGLGLFQRSALPEEKSDERAYAQVQGGWRERAGTLAFTRLIPTAADDPTAALLAQASDVLASAPPRALIVWGMKDAFFGRAALDAWKSRLPAARVVELAEDGRLLPERSAAAIVKAVEEFLAEQGEPTKSAARLAERRG